MIANIAASTIKYFGKDNYTATVRLDSLVGSNISSQSRVEIVTSGSVIWKSFRINPNSFFQRRLNRQLAYRIQHTDHKCTIN